MWGPPKGGTGCKSVELALFGHYGHIYMVIKAMRLDEIIKGKNMMEKRTRH